MCPKCTRARTALAMSPMVTGLTVTCCRGAPPLGHQREGAFALVAHRGQHVAGLGVRGEFAAAGRFADRTCTLATCGSVPTHRMFRLYATRSGALMIIEAH